MKIENVLEMVKLLGNIKLNKFPKELRTPILLNHVALNKIAKEFNADVEEMRKKILEGKEEDVQKLMQYRTEFSNAKEDDIKKEIELKILNECFDVLLLEQELNKLVFDKLHSTTSVEIKKIPMEMFIEACTEADIDITPDMLTNVADLFE